MTARGKNLALLLGFAVIAAVLVLVAYYGVEKPDEAEKKQKEIAEKIMAVPDSPTPASGDPGAGPAVAFEKLVVQARGETTTLEKSGEQWQITSPVKAPADQTTANGIANELRSAKFKSTVEEKPSEDDLTKYGLKEPRFTVTASATVGDAKHEVQLSGGIENSFDGSIYVRRAGDEKVYAAPGSLRTALEKSTFELRDKELFAFDEAKLNEISVKAPKGGFHVKRDADNAWQLASPPYPADAELLSQMLGSLKGEKAASFPPDSPENRKAFGLTKAAVEATFVGAEGEKTRVLFSAVSSGKAFVLKEGPQGQTLLAEVMPSAQQRLQKSHADLKNRSVLSFKKDQVAKAVFSPGNGGPELVVERSGDTNKDEWALTAPDKGQAQKWKVSTALWALTNLKASELGTENPRTWAKYGLSEKAKSVSLFDKEGKKMAQLLIGKAVPNKPASVYVRGSRSQVMEVESARLAELPFAPGDLLEKKEAPPEGSAPPQPAAPAPLPAQ